MRHSRNFSAGIHFQLFISCAMRLGLTVAYSFKRESSRPAPGFPMEEFGNDTAPSHLEHVIPSLIPAQQASIKLLDFFHY